jgi:hypothetical protein
MLYNKNIFFALFLAFSVILLSGCKFPGFKKKTAACNEKQCKITNKIDSDNWEK